jgi:caspase domain-containing protein
MDAPSGTVVAFATSPGSVASDGAGRNGLYTQYLIENVQRPGLKIEEVFKQVRAAVRRDSNGQQTPWESTSLEGDFYFHPVDLAAVEVARKQQEQARLEQAIRVAVAQERERVLKELEDAKGIGSTSSVVAAEKPPVLAAAPMAAVPTGPPPTGAKPPPADAASPSAVAPSTPPSQASRPPDKVASIAPQLTQPGSKPSQSSNVPVAADQVIGTRVQGKIPAPRIDVGDEWEFLTLETDTRYAVRDPVTRIDRFTVVNESDGKPTITYSVLDAPGGLSVRTSKTYSARAGLESGLTNANEISGVRKLLLFALDTDTKWSYSYEYPRGDGTKGRADFESKVFGWELVTVPAGTFWALKIEQQGWAYNLSTVERSRDPARQRTLLWYSPEVKHIVKLISQGYCSLLSRCVMQSVRTSELIRFTAAASRATK